MIDDVGVEVLKKVVAELQPGQHGSRLEALAAALCVLLEGVMRETIEEEGK